MDYNLLLAKLSSIEDSALRISARNWVAETMLPTMVKFNVELHLENEKVVDCDGTGVGGWFSDEPSPVLAVALDNETWLDTMIHEFAHLQQWVENSIYWEPSSCSVLVDHWYAHDCELNKEQLDKYFRALIDVEVDAERRALKMIKHYEIPIDTKLYAQKANAYVLCYHEYRRRRRWNVPGKAPYLFPEIVAAMPTNMTKVNYHDSKSVTAKMKRLYDRCFED